MAFAYAVSIWGGDFSKRAIPLIHTSALGPINNSGSGRLDEKEPVPQIGGNLPSYIRINMGCWYDIQDRQLEDFLRMVLGEPA